LALNLGFGGIEIDTWLAPSTDRNVLRKKSNPHLSPTAAVNDSLSPPSISTLAEEASYIELELDLDWTLVAGHRAIDILDRRTLSELYFEPLMKRLDMNNADARMTRLRNDSWVGVHPGDPSAELLILIDMVSSVSLQRL